MLLYVIDALWVAGSPLGCRHKIMSSLEFIGAIRKMKHSSQDASPQHNNL